MKQYEQIVSIYGRFVVQEETEEKAQNRLDNMVYNFKARHSLMISEGLIVGDIEREAFVDGGGMMGYITCEICEKKFWGMHDKENTCPECLKGIMKKERKGGGK